VIRLGDGLWGVGVVSEFMGVLGKRILWGVMANCHCMCASGKGSSGVVDVEFVRGPFGFQEDEEPLEFSCVVCVCVCGARFLPVARLPGLVCRVVPQQAICFG